MKIYLIEPSQRTDITQLIKKIVWSGDEKQAARKMELEVTASTDENIPKISLSPGNMLKLLDDNGVELFAGVIFYQERSRSNHMIRVTAYDSLIYLLKSKATYNFKKTTAESIAARIASDFVLSVGELKKTGIIQNLLVNAQSPYEIITAAYTAAGKQNGKRYNVQMQNGKLFVLEKGTITAITASLVIGSNLNITDATYSESIENMINRVMIYNDNGDSLGKVESQEWMKKYGVLQEIYQKEAGSDPKTVAKSMLKGLERNGNISVLGNSECLTGKSVKILEPFTGLKGLFEIATDAHTWQDGSYMMDLGLKFSNIE
ncbi:MULTISPECIES: hypothetical protein [unclassified Dehalobacter]|uniref:XkdQ/YqbQ family protein n=1 Tax=unclassified Dehalobacter TaxID=2635733 RepID=UPI000E6D0F83|nr:MULTISPECIES: hypothetical protein [unclassified Dehalobacter]TCX53390.1 hypothetical protein C1I36_01150 [Dehalobacter sp. 14DCB1]TCX54405.1 hypothetical protein C1I38_06535 [Dehalobacter sp. 12DCB1]